MNKLKTKFRIFLSVSSMLFTSCATTLNQPLQRIFIATDNNIKSVTVNRSTLTDSTLIRIDAPKIYYVPRSPNPLIVELQLDSTKKIIVLKARNSFAYWANIYFNYGLGMLVDRDNTKRYSYPQKNYFTVEDTTIKRHRFPPIRKGTINLSLSLPFLGIFDLQSGNGKYTSAGIFGLETGVDFFYKNNQYVSVNIGVGTDATIVEHLGPGYFETGSSVFASVRNNHVLGSFDIGYGINVSQLQWRKMSIGDTINLDQSVKNNALGFSLSAQYRMGNYFRFGLLYQPDLFTTNRSPAFNYQHYISLDLTWKLPVRNAKEN